MPTLLQILARKLKAIFNPEIDETPVPTPPAPPELEPVTLKPKPTPAPPAAMSLPPLETSAPESALVIDLGDAQPAEKPKKIIVRNKIGFHTGPGGNPSGLGDWMRSLDKAGIPFMIKSVDSYGPVFEASELAKKSGVEHVLVYRVSKAGQGSRYDYDVPPYKDPKFVNDPEGGAEKHWAKTMKKIPPEFDKERTWLEPINEVDKDLCDWLGRFAVHTANLAQRDGFKVSLFAWSSGEPEPEGWEEPGMLAYLRLCAERPNQAAVALHEYSYVRKDIKHGFPFKIGRFKALFDVCDKYLIARPTVHMTEWGWTLDKVPQPEQAIKDIDEIMQLYGRYPEITGAAIWYLGPSFGGIANKAQKLIKPVTDFTLNTTFELTTDPPQFKPESHPVDPPIPVDPDQPDPIGPDAPDPIEPDPPEPVVPDPPEPPEPVEPDPPEPVEPDPPEPVEPPRANIAYMADITIPDDTRMTGGTTFTKTWRVRNNGNVAWTSAYKLVHVKGESMTQTIEQAIPVIQPGQEAEISIEMTVPTSPGVYFSDWQLRDLQGNFVGDVLFTRIIAEQPAVQTSNSAYVADVTIPDDTVISPGQSFVKTWRVKNTGTTSWNADFKLEFIEGVAMTNRTSQPMPTVPPGAETEISLTLTAPMQKGTHFGDWKIKDKRGVLFGDILFFRIVVK